MKCSFLLGITRQNFIEMARQIKKKNSDLGSGGGIIQYIDPSPPLLPLTYLSVFTNFSLQPNLGQEFQEFPYSFFCS